MGHHAMWQAAVWQPFLVTSVKKSVGAFTGDEFFSPCGLMEFRGSEKPFALHPCYPIMKKTQCNSPYLRLSLCA